MPNQLKKILGFAAGILATLAVLTWAIFVYAQAYLPGLRSIWTELHAEINSFFSENENGTLTQESPSSTSATARPAPSTPSSTKISTANPPVIATPTAPSSAALTLKSDVTRPLPYDVSPYEFTITPWLADWGEDRITDGTLAFGASTSGNGGTIFLSDSSAWEDYSFDANISWDKGEAFGMIARASDVNDFVYCDFGNGSAGIIERSGQTQTTLAQAADADATTGASEDFGARVYGKKIACSIEGHDVVTALLPAASPPSGNVGFTSWDPASNNSEITINSLDIEPLTNDNIAVPLFVPVAPSAPAAPTSTAPVTVPATTTPEIQLPYQETNFSNDKNWQSTWGAMSIDASHFMTVGADASTTGGEVLLNGSNLWNDYILTTTIQWKKGQTFSLVTRRASDGDEILCSFGNNGTINIERLWNSGQTQLIGQGTAANFSTSADIQAFAEVNGTHVTCGINNTTVASYLAPQLTSGGIGFDTWDPATNNSMITVKAITVTPAP